MADDWEAVYDELGMTEGEFHDRVGDLRADARDLAEVIDFNIKDSRTDN